MAEVIKAIVRVRRGTFAKWQEANPVLKEGQMGLVSDGQDKGKFKVGDGITAWNNLPYTIGADGKAGTLESIETVTLDAGRSANVTNRGTGNAAELVFEIPQGERGYPGQIVPDITELSYIDELNPDDLLYVYEQQTGLLKKISYENLVNCPIGSGYTQGPNDPTPPEKGLPGHWEPWNHRAEIYEMATTYPDEPLENYTPGENYAINAYVIYQVPNSSHRRIIRANKAITGAPEDLNPIDWIFPGEANYGHTITRAFRRNVQSSLTADDLTIGATVSGGEHNNKRILGVITRAGTFPSWAGGYRPTFESGGVARDAIRNFPATSAGTYYYTPDGPFAVEVYSGLNLGSSGWYLGSLSFDPSRVVPTGSQNTPETLPEIYWRRVS